jgi:8-oxo-dGTP pyrophosphatase MutT (NUDIX family)
VPRATVFGVDGSHHVRVVVIWQGQLLLVQHHDPRDGKTFWMPPGGGSYPGETPEQAAVREVREETGLDVRVLRSAHVPAERGYECFVAELVGPPDITPEVEEPCEEIFAIGAGWHHVSAAAPLALMESEHWSELAALIREELVRQ